MINKIKKIFINLKWRIMLNPNSKILPIEF